jgi:hypothetical protein
MKFYQILSGKYVEYDGTYYCLDQEKSTDLLLEAMSQNGSISALSNPVIRHASG